MATGTRPTRVSEEAIPGISNAIDSDDVFFLKELPKKTVVIGGILHLYKHKFLLSLIKAGYIAMETACFLAGLGSSVSVVVRSKILRSFDDQVVRQLEENLEQIENMDILNKAQVKEIKKNNDGTMEVRVHSEGQSEKIISGVDCVVLAIGRDFNPKHIGLDSVKEVVINQRR